MSGFVRKRPIPADSDNLIKLRRLQPSAVTISFPFSQHHIRISPAKSITTVVTLIAIWRPI